MSSNSRAGLWLLLDMCLHILALVLVKALGADYPIAQLVFFRAAVGVFLLMPWIAVSHKAFSNIVDWPLQTIRVTLSTVALSCGYYAVSQLPLALFTALNYLRPAILMIMAVVFLGEWIGRRRWVAVAIGFLGVVIALQPGEFIINGGLWALSIAVIAGSAATIILRKLKGTPEIVMMLFYTLGLTLLSAPFATLYWEPIGREDMFSLVAIGVFAQSAQFCFLRAHWLGDVGYLGPISYFSLLLSALAGFLFFNEIPSAAVGVGAVIIVLSAALINRAGSKVLRK